MSAHTILTSIIAFLIAAALTSGYGHMLVGYVSSRMSIGAPVIRSPRLPEAERQSY